MSRRPALVRLRRRAHEQRKQLLCVHAARLAGRVAPGRGRSAKRRAHWPRGRHRTRSCSSARSGSCPPDAARSRASARASGPRPGRSARRSSACAAARKMGRGPGRSGASSHTCAARSGQSGTLHSSGVAAERARCAPVGQRASSHARRGHCCGSSLRRAAIGRLCYRHLISRVSSPTVSVRKHDAVGRARVVG